MLPDAFPWWGLLALATAAFTDVVTDLLPAGLLPQMSGALHVPEARAGLLRERLQAHRLQRGRRSRRQRPRPGRRLMHHAAQQGGRIAAPTPAMAGRCRRARRARRAPSGSA